MTLGNENLRTTTVTSLSYSDPKSVLFTQHLTVWKVTRVGKSNHANKLITCLSHREHRHAKRCSQRVTSMVGGWGIMVGPVQKLFELGGMKERCWFSGHLLYITCLTASFNCSGELPPASRWLSFYTSMLTQMRAQEKGINRGAERSFLFLFWARFTGSLRSNTERSHVPFI